MSHRIPRTISKIVLKILFLGSIVVSFFYRSCVSAFSPFNTTEQLQYQGRTREYLVHLPSNYHPNQIYPLVLAFHGRLGTSSGMQSLSGFNAIADANQFIVVYPQGVERSWADGRGTTPADHLGVDDVGFMAALMDQLSKT